MKRIIQVDLFNKEDLFEKYNRNIISKDLIKYIIDNTIDLKKNDSIQIIINNKIKELNNCLPLILEALNQEYNYTICKYRKNNLRQAAFFVVGIITLFIYTLISDLIFKEIVLIGGWVLLWEVVEMELFEDINIRRKKIILRKLLKSEFIENKS